jgi:polysaccharide export outer membrane protein
MVKGYLNNIRILLGLLLGFIVGCTPVESISPQLALPLSPEQAEVAMPATLAKFQSPLHEDDDSNYRLGTGDHITIDIWGYPELSGQHIIGPDGKITLPLIGDFYIVDLSREKAAQAIIKAFSPYYFDLVATVRVDQYVSNRILILGQISRPGQVQFDMTPPTLLEAISLAGGLTATKGGRHSLPFTRCAIFRGRDKIIWIELEPLLTGKDLSLNIRLKRHDIVYIPDVEEKLIYVLGEVRRPGAIALTPRMSFIEALAKAGGPTIDAASNRLHIIRPKEGINQSLALSELITPNLNMNVALQEGDILYVPTNMIAKVNYAVNFLNPFSNILSIYANIESIRADRQRRQLDDLQERVEKERAAIEAEKEANVTLE